MEVKEQTHPNGSNLDLLKLKPDKTRLVTTESFIAIKSSTIHLTIAGNRNRIRIEDSAGRLSLEGSENQLEIKKSWLSCQIDGNANLFALVHSEFQLRKHQGTNNFIPGVLGQHPLHIANRRLILQERFINLRVNSVRENSKSIKKYWPNLVKSNYCSEVRQCPICYDDIKPPDQVTSLFCFHLFHSVCIEACLETTTKCPVCSLDILQFIKDQLKSGSYVAKQDELLMKESMEDEEKQ